MIIALLGGDGRSVRLCSLLRADGHRVQPFALEQRLDCLPDAAAAAAGADCILLPLPCETAGALNAPFTAGTYGFAELLSAAAPGTPVCAGRAPEALRSVCRKLKLPLTDVLLREDFNLRNAELTAEGALGLLLQGEDALRGSRVLIGGYGRIGRALASKLRALGAQVTVAARRPEDRTAAGLAGCEALSFGAAPGEPWDAVVNTVPAPVFGEAALASFGDARLIELASAPYGFDFDAARRLGKPVELAAGLPGKTAPLAAAKALRDTVYAIMEG